MTAWRVLLAEDEPLMAQMMADMLAELPVEVTLARNGREALAQMERVQPDLVLLDIRMPRLTGYDVCRRLRADPTTQHIPIAFLSAKGQEAEIQAGMDAGATDYILKPFAPDQLVTRVGLLLGEPRRDV
jgi:DNA-binding response OmpR family regulator